MPATPKHDVVRLRLTTLEKQDWIKAAGGARKLSEWMRATCNAAAEQWRREHSPGMTDLMVSPETIEQYLAEQLPPGAVVPVEVGQTTEAALAQAVDAYKGTATHVGNGEFEFDPPIPNAKPVIIGDAIERSLHEHGLDNSGLAAQVRDEAGSASTAAGDASEVAGPRPAVAKDQAHRESRPMPATEARRADSSAGDRTGVSSGDGSGCPRWMHHRPGVYCGACKRVIGK